MRRMRTSVPHVRFDERRLKTEWVIGSADLPPRQASTLPLHAPILDGTGSQVSLGLSPHGIDRYSAHSFVNGNSYITPIEHHRNRRLHPSNSLHLYATQIAEGYSYNQCAG